MGQIIELRCPQCGVERTLFTGGGLRDCELNTILAALPEKAQSVLTNAVGAGAKWVTIDRRPAVCGGCGSIFALPVVTYTLNSERNELCGACPGCGRDGTDAEYGAVFCPDCGSAMTETLLGNWD